MTKRQLTLPILEIFGPTFQGEGRAIGQKTMFVRTGAVTIIAIGAILLLLGMARKSLSE